MYIRLYILSLIVLLSYTKSYSQDKSINFKFGISGGLIVSKIAKSVLINNYDSTNTLISSYNRDTKNIALPQFGVSSLLKFKNHFDLKIGLQNSTRGCNIEQPIRKYRLNFFDLNVMPGFEILPGLSIYSGLQYSFLYMQYYKVLNGSFRSGEERVKIDNYKSRPEFKAGISMSLEEKADIFAYYTKPFSSLEQSSFELGVCIYINNSDKNSKPKVIAKSLEELFANPLKYTSLVLHRKNIEELPPEIGKCTNLEEIFLDGNFLNSLPKEIGNLTNLKVLSVKSNHLSTLPDEIGNLTNLEILKLNFNKLQHLPESICNLYNLKFLILSDNRIDYLPNDFGKLEGLIELDIYDSGIISLPISIKNIRKLERIYCSPENTYTLLQTFPATINPRLQIINTHSDF
ncbi:MAG: hypothetical protein A2033_09730 [Bacteroidetes bacterium GWA2_31_9]|nr:MAG: hypothetical protein A2033_09730 [Bacteroidetes bacterium GWA2_31_9]